MKKGTSTKNTIVFDLETRTLIPNLKDEKAKNKAIEKMEISVLCCYHYDEKKYTFYTHKNISDFLSLAHKAKKVVGYNVLQFDYLVLKKHGLKKSILKNTIDIFDHIKSDTGEWISLHNLSIENLGRGKLAKGKEMPKLSTASLYKACKGDVRNVKDLYDLFITGKLKYKHLKGRTGARRRFYDEDHDNDSERGTYSPFNKCPKCGKHGFQRFDEPIEGMTEGQLAEYMAGNRGTIQCLNCGLIIDY